MRRPEGGEPGQGPSGTARGARQTKLVLRLKSVGLAWTTLALVAGCVVAQVALGAEPLVLALVIVACGAGLAGFRIAGAYHAAAWLALFFVLGNAIVALVAKTLFLQPLDSHLYAPTEAFIALAAGSAVLFIALLMALTIPVGQPLFRPVKSVGLLRWLSTSTFAIGTLFWYFNRLFQDPEGPGFGGVAVFRNLVLMAVIARTAMILQRSDGRQSLDLKLLLILVTCVAMGLIDNSKTEVALPIVAYFAMSVFSRGGITLRQAGAGALGFLLMAALIGPMIHVYRALGIQEMSWQRRVQLIRLGVSDALDNGSLLRYNKIVSEQFRSGYYNYFGAEGSGQLLLGRYASIQQIDPVIATVRQRGTLGGTVIWPSFARLVPSFIYPDKPRYTESYRLLVQLGLINPEGGKYPVVPLLAQSYAGYGTVGLLLIPFLTFLGFLLALKKLGWRLRQNVFAVFYFCVFIVVYANQGDLGQYAGAVLRTFPLLAAVLWLLVRIYGLRLKPLYSQSSRPVVAGHAPSATR